MTWTFEQVLQSMRELDAFLKRIGLHTEAGRFSVHIKAIETLDAAQKRGSVDEIDNDQALWSMTEAIELAEVDALKEYSPSILARKFREVLQGPPRPTVEDENTNHGRNTAFELSMATWFCRQGVFRGLFDNPDVPCEVAGVPVLVQCKRPLGEKGISETSHAPESNYEVTSQEGGTRRHAASSRSRCLGLLARVQRCSGELIRRER
jgi:hypothetical protein